MSHYGDHDIEIHLTRLDYDKIIERAKAGDAIVLEREAEILENQRRLPAGYGVALFVAADGLEGYMPMAAALEFPPEIQLPCKPGQHQLGMEIYPASYQYEPNKRRIYRRADHLKGICGRPIYLEVA